MIDAGFVDVRKTGHRALLGGHVRIAYYQAQRSVS